MTQRRRGAGEDWRARERLGGLEGQRAASLADVLHQSVQQPILEHVAGERSVRNKAGLFDYSRPIRRHRFRADMKLLGNALQTDALCDELQDAQLSVGQRLMYGS